MHTDKFDKVSPCKPFRDKRFVTNDLSSALGVIQLIEDEQTDCKHKTDRNLRCSN